MRRSIAVIALLGVLGAVDSAQAVNKLFNGDLESSPAFSYYDGVSATDPNLVPGWTMFGHTPPDTSSWVQVAFDGVDNNTDLDLSGSEVNGDDPDFVGLSGIMTAAGSRPVVAPGSSYLASVTYDNYFGSAGISYFIDWFDGGGNLISSDGGPLGDPNGPFGYAPYTQRFEISGTAPVGAASAGVRFLSSNGSFAGAAADNFSLVPEPGTAALAVLALCGMATFGRRRS